MYNYSHQMAVQYIVVSSHLYSCHEHCKFLTVTLEHKSKSATWVQASIY